MTLAVEEIAAQKARIAATAYVRIRLVRHLRHLRRLRRLEVAVALVIHIPR